MREYGFDVAGQPIEQWTARDHSVLHDFVQTRSEFTPRECFQQVRIDDDDRRLMKRANQVFPKRVVDADLAADRTVHLREQRRWHVGQRDAAQK